MAFHRLIVYFLPPHLKNNPLHEHYEERYTHIQGLLWCAVLIPALALGFYFNVFLLKLLFYNMLINVAALPFYKWNLHRPIHVVISLSLYWLYFPLWVETGGIFSVNLVFLHFYLICVLLYLHPKLSIVFVAANLAVLWLLYERTEPAALSPLGSKNTALVVHMVSTLFIGVLFWWIQRHKDQLTLENKKLQNRQITHLHTEVDRLHQDMNRMRQALAADFHDETGNLLSVITRQATLLKLSPDPQPGTQAILEHIITSSNQLYESSRHFLWHLNQDSDHPLRLFEYLTSVGQTYFNSLDISFSAHQHLPDAQTDRRLPPFAAINLIFIFREAMTNIVKHAGATEVQLTLRVPDEPNRLAFELTDNGHWKQPDPDWVHHGLDNIQKRCHNHHFRYTLRPTHPTRLTIGVPLLPTFDSLPAHA